jgi:hypothetical protein
MPLACPKKWTIPVPEIRIYTASFTYTVYSVYKPLCPNDRTNIPGKTKANRSKGKDMRLISTLPTLICTYGQAGKSAYPFTPNGGFSYRVDHNQQQLLCLPQCFCEKICSICDMKTKIITVPGRPHIGQT